MNCAALLLSVAITVLPAAPLIEQTKSGQALNFDLLLRNDGSAPVTIEEVEATVLAPDGKMIAQRRLSSNGGSIDLLLQRELKAGEKMVVFNPFPELERDLDLGTIRYDFKFENERSSVTVNPRPYDTKADLILPMRGRVFVHDGHDFLSHHRRLDITGGMTTALGITTNMMRYAYDLVLVDERGSMHRGDGEKNEEWYGFGQPILAPADGTVVLARGDQPDGTKSQRAPLDRDAVMKDVSMLFGNVVIIDHGSGEFSVLGHMRQGSVPVKTGERVKRGQKIGELGASGDAMFPHLHYQLQRDAKTGEGLPSYFRDFKRFTGKSWVRVKRGHVDTGDVVESAR
ncbi:MAG TPA: M23 family metallopeptidase [Thermoanaerobaculia bacterium]|jgi:hypothetical protein